MSERSQTVPVPEGEYFESSRFTGLSFLLGLIAVVALALCLCVFLYALRWLLFLGNRPSCYRRRMVGRRATPVGKHCGITRGPGAIFCADPSSPPSSLLVDGHSTRRGSFARFKTGLSQLEFLSWTRDFVPRLFCFCSAHFAAVVRATGQGR